jgi:hypothetical protein
LTERKKHTHIQTDRQMKRNKHTHRQTKRKKHTSKKQIKIYTDKDGQTDSQTD